MNFIRLFSRELFCPVEKSPHRAQSAAAVGDDRNAPVIFPEVSQQLIEFQDAGLGSAAATSLFLIIAILTAIVISAGRVNVSASGDER